MTTRNKKTKRTTVYLDPVLLKVMRYQALINETSVSEMINDAIRNQITEDAEDIADIDARKNEPLIPFEEVVKRLKLDGLI
jgi:hypothetical protein